MTEQQKQEERLVKRSELTSWIEEYIHLCRQCGFNDQYIAEDVADCLCDSSDRRIIIDDMTIRVTQQGNQKGRK